MRKADNTIVFGSPNVGSTVPVASAAPTSPRFPEPSVPPPSVPVVRERPLLEELDEHPTYMTRPERGIAFAAVSLALIGVAAVGTYLMIGRTKEPTVSTTSTTSAEVKPADTTAEAPSPTPAPAAAPPDQPWEAPEVDAVRDPRLPKAQLAREVASPQMLPAERPQPQASPTPAPATNAAKIEGAQPAPVQTAKKAQRNPATKYPPGMSDEALERAGFYGTVKPVGPETNPAPEPRAPSAASTEEPKQFTPPPAPAEVMPDMQIKE